MGKGTIISGGANGLYTLNVDYGDALRQQYLTQINKRLSELGSAVPLAQAKVIDQNATIANADNVVQAAISAYNAALLANPEGQYPELQKAIQDAVTAYAAEVAKLKPLQGEVNVLKSEQTSLGSRSSYLNSLNLIKVAPAWCADFTEDAIGQVATIEIPGEPDKVLIAPGAPQPQSTDGQVLARDVLREDQAFLNAALLPGWQKWKPTFRIGTITFVNKEANTCSVDVQYTESSANQLPINQTEFLSGVPIDYMDCDAAVFEEGDQVVVKFEGQNWNNPKVIGFVNNPKACGGLSFNGSVYREPNYVQLNTDPTKYNTVYIYVGFIVRIPASISESVYASDNCIFTINGHALDKNYRGGSKYAYPSVFDNYAWFDADINIPNQRPGGFDRFYADIGVFEADPEYWWIPECKSIMLYFTLQQDIFPGTAPGDLSTVEAAYAANSSYDIYLEVDGKVLIDGIITTTTQSNYGAISNGYACTYDGTYSPATPWTWNGAGIAIPPEVTWIT